MNSGWKKGMPSPNPKGRPKGRSDEVLAAIKSEFGGEPQFWKHLAKAAKDGDQACMSLLVSRVRAPYKAASKPVTFDLDTSDLPSALRSVIEATASGEIDPDAARDITTALASASAVAHQSEVESRLAALEESVNAL